MIKKYVVTDEDNLYVGCTGTYITESKLTVFLDMDVENVVFQKHEVKEITDLEYDFEPMRDGNYQVRLRGVFVCYSNHTDPEGIDQVLKEYGWNSREEFIKGQ